MENKEQLSKYNELLSNVLTRNLCKLTKQHMLNIFKRKIETPENIASILVVLTPVNSNESKHFNLNILLVFKETYIFINLYSIKFN